MTVTKSFPHGYWQVSDIVAGHLVSRTYIGYTKREAIAAFKEEVQS